MSATKGNQGIIVGYALNAKKLRKGHNSTNIIVKRSSSENSVYKDLSSSEINSLQHWQGGGLADILENAAIYSTGDGDNPNIKFIPWNPFLPLNQQPHFDVLIHKLTEDIGASDEDPSEKQKENSKLIALTAYLKLHSSTVLVDPIMAVKKVTSRARTCATLALIQNKTGSQRCPFSQPKFIILEAADKNDPFNESDVLEALVKKNINFPVICKPVVACGTSNSHNMVSKPML